ncbi:hypothetical protein [Sphingobium terrigena]|uniref:hypothetical protein n=1 Tax=Sphingobium terrigena TaxID=2304063 RepID=UPI0011C3979F|nr:hypothetical protein [Sphingobium terrigena]
MGVFLHTPTYGEISHLSARDILAQAWENPQKWRKLALFQNWHGPCKAWGNPHTHKRNVTKAKVQGVIIMEENNNSVREIGQLMSVALAALLLGSTLILSAVGPARASEAPMLASQTTPVALRYLA